MRPDNDERPATSADVEAILAQLKNLRAELATLKGQPPPLSENLGGVAQLPTSPLYEQLVTLDQIGAMVHRSKRSMERYRHQLPPPHVEGRRGQPHLWVWAEVRPWLEATFGFHLPEYFPGRTH